MDPSLLDTDTYSEILRASNRNVIDRSNEYRDRFERFSLSAVTVYELVGGMQRAQLGRRLEALKVAIDAEEIIPIDKQAAIVAGRILGDLLRTGQTIGKADPMIAAIAIQHDLTLITGNTQHFERIARLGYALRLDNWRN